MAEICVNTTVRNGDDFIELVLRAVMPYARVVVTVDSRSQDNTREIVSGLGVEWDEFEIKNPARDLVAMRNHQLEKVKEDYVWIVDSDEYYPKESAEYISKFDFTEGVYALKCWAIWNQFKAHRASSKNPIPRIFKKEGFRWKKRFGKEVLSKIEPVVLPVRYIHFTHLKKDTWRKEMGMLRVSDDKHLIDLPPEIQNETRNILGQKNVADPLSHSVMGEFSNTDEFQKNS